MAFRCEEDAPFKSPTCIIYFMSHLEIDYPLLANIERILLLENDVIMLTFRFLQNEKTWQRCQTTGETDDRSTGSSLSESCLKKCSIFFCIVRRKCCCYIFISEFIFDFECYWAESEWVSAQFKLHTPKINQKTKLVIIHLSLMYILSQKQTI